MTAGCDGMMIDVLAVDLMGPTCIRGLVRFIDGPIDDMAGADSLLAVVDVTEILDAA